MNLDARTLTLVLAVAALGLWMALWPANVTVLSGDRDQLIWFKNGRILTMDFTDIPFYCLDETLRYRCWVNHGVKVYQSMLVRGEHIVHLDSDARMWDGPWRYTSAEIIEIDLRGRTLMPGFVDPHSHFFNDAQHRKLFAGTDDLQEAFEKAQYEALANGFTTIGDAFVNEFYLSELRTFHADDKLKLRTLMYLIYNQPNGRVDEEWYLTEGVDAYVPDEVVLGEAPRPPSAPERLRTIGVKVYADGGIPPNGCPAISFHFVPEAGCDESTGDLWLSTETLTRVIQNAHDDGFQVVVHAIGDVAVAQAHLAYAEVLGGGPNALRHRMDHNVVVPPHSLTRYGELDLVTVVFGHYETCIEIDNPVPFWFEHTRGDTEKLRWIEPNASLLRANPGLHMAWHGDDPQKGPFGPFEELYNFATRNDIRDDGSVCVAPDWLRAETLTVHQALPLMNRDAAYALHMDEFVGTLEAGKLADFIIVSDDPWTTDVDNLPHIEVLSTWIGGQDVYCAPGFRRALCPLSRGLDDPR